MVRKDLNISSVNELDGATTCVAQGSTSELNIADYFGSRGMSYQIATFADLDEARNAYEEGRCDAWSNDRGTIAARSQALKNKDAHMQIGRASCRERVCP